MGNVAVVDPAATITVVGTDALVLPELSEIETPLAGAGPEIVTVPADELPPTTGVGEIVKAVRDGGRTVSVVCTIVPASVAVITPVVAEDTPDVEAVKLAEVAPDGTVTEAGTETPPPEALRLTVAPPVGAPRVRVTVPVALVPPGTEVGETLTADRSGV
jgi:hypothetical protein